MACGYSRCTVITAFALALWMFTTRYVLNILVPRSEKLKELQSKIAADNAATRKVKRKITLNNLHSSIVLSRTAVPPVILSPSTKTAKPRIKCDTGKFKCSYNIHIFYYGWYGNPKYDGRWLHWNHPRLPHWNKQTAKRYSQRRHVPENNDIGSIYYPSLGFYSSHDPKVVENHMSQIKRAGAGVLVVSWYPPEQHDNEGRASDELIPLLLDKAANYGLRIAFHIEPYKHRSAKSVKNDVKYIIDTYGNHTGFYKEEKSNLPMIYVYDSYLIPASSWSTILGKSSSESIRGTKYDSIMIGLLVEDAHKQNILSGHWDGFYTYFAVNGMTYGSTFHNFHTLRIFADENELIYIPSVGPGYNDVPVRPWNNQNSRDRRDGKYYEEALGYAKRNTKRFISITSFNEWHEGTNIETAIGNQKREDSSGAWYKDYGTNGKYHYIDLTRKMLLNFD